MQSWDSPVHVPNAIQLGASPADVNLASPPFGLLLLGLLT